MLYYGRGEIGDGDDDSSDRVGRDNVQSGKEEKLVLASISNLYSKLKEISVGTSGPSSCSTLYYLPTTCTLREMYMILT